jgi:hypothetical protein
VLITGNDEYEMWETGKNSRPDIDDIIQAVISERDMYVINWEQTSTLSRPRVLPVICMQTAACSNGVLEVIPQRYPYPVSSNGHEPRCLRKSSPMSGSFRNYGGPARNSTWLLT